MKSKSRFGNDDAQIAVIIFFGLTIAFIAFFWILLGGGIMDPVTTVHNNLTSNNGLPISQERQNAMSFLQNLFDAWPVVAFILTIVMLIFHGIQSRDTRV